MRVDQALARIGVTVVKLDKAEKRVTLFLRVSTEKDHVQMWTSLVNDFLDVASAPGERGWTVDLSKSFFFDRDAKTTRYLWRLIFRGDTNRALDTLQQAAIRALASAKEVVSMPLIGRVQYEHDPSRGKIKGAYGVGEGELMIARAAAGGGS
jgi:hypothetical protein